MSEHTAEGRLAGPSPNRELVERHPELAAIVWKVNATNELQDELAAAGRTSELLWARDCQKLLGLVADLGERPKEPPTDPEQWRRLQTACETLREERDTAVQERESLDHQHAVLLARQAAAVQALARVESRVAELEREQKAYTSAFIEQCNANNDLRGKWAHAQGQRDALARELAAAREERDTLARHLVRYHPKDECEILRLAAALAAGREGETR